MASGPITSWQIDGEKVERDGKKVKTVTDFNFLCSKITADGDCSHEIKSLKSIRMNWMEFHRCSKNEATKLWILHKKRTYIS